MSRKFITIAAFIGITYPHFTLRAGVLGVGDPGTSTEYCFFVYALSPGQSLKSRMQFDNPLFKLGWRNLVNEVGQIQFDKDVDSHTWPLFIELTEIQAQKRSTEDVEKQETREATLVGMAADLLEFAKQDRVPEKDIVKFSSFFAKILDEPKFPAKLRTYAAAILFVLHKRIEADGIIMQIVGKHVIDPEQEIRELCVATIRLHYIELNAHGK